MNFSQFYQKPDHNLVWCGHIDFLQSFIYLLEKLWTTSHFLIKHFTLKLTCFPLWPPYRIRDIIFCTKHILEYLSFSIKAAHIPMTASRLCLGHRVCVDSRSIMRKVGAYFSSSERSLLQVKSLSSKTDWWERMELVLSEHINLSSFRRAIPILFKRYTLVLFWHWPLSV